MAAPTNTDQKPPVYLLDTMGFVFRAYHAMQRSRPMSTRTGVPTAATYVFINMINKLRADFAPHYIAAIYEGGAPVHRNEAAATMKTVRKFNIKTQQFDEVDYLGYKANRTETPPDLEQQQPYIRRALEAFRIPILAHEGFEADDVIGTLSCRLAEQGHHVYIVSSDKDMMQLVNDRVSILNPMKDNLILTPDKVEEVLGVRPERVVDVMALRGDAIDNVPGAPGIGDKGSVELIQQFGTVEAAIDTAQQTPDSIKRKTYRESLANNRDNIMLSKELVTIHCNLPVEYSLEDMAAGADPNLPVLRELYTELEFTTLLKNLAPAPTAETAKLITKPTADDIAALVATAKQNNALSFFFAEDLHALAAEVCADEDSASSETSEEEKEPAPAQNMSLFGAPQTASTSKGIVIPNEESNLLSSEQPLMLGAAADDKTALLLDLNASEASEIKALLADTNIPKSTHDLKSALRVAAQHNIELNNIAHDVMLYSYLVNPTHGSHKLHDVAARYNAAPIPVSQVKNAPPPDTALPASASAIHFLQSILLEQVKEGDLTKTYAEIDLPLVPVLQRMEEAGVRIDTQLLRDMSSKLAIDMDSLAERIYTLSGHRFNINSPKQLGDVLFNKMDLPKPLKYGKGKVISTAVDVLEELAAHHEVPSLVLEYRGLVKLRSNYTEQLPQLADANARIHTTFNQVGTATGRLSSTEPNLQNIPVKTELGRQIRAAFTASPDTGSGGHVILSADYSQIELRLMAHFSQDPLLLDAYRTNRDIHTLTASEVFGVDPATMSKETRNRAKAVNFGIVYGISPFGLAAQLGIPQSEAKQYIETYFERYAGVHRFIEETINTTRATGKVTTLFGRSRPIPDIGSRNPNMRGFAERTAVNTPLQGTAADMIKVAMIRIDAELRKQNLKSVMTLQVHDELLFEAPESEAEAVSALVKKEMESVVELSIPIVAEVGRGYNWRDAK
ncbi:MAG: DNA polymerase I [Acidobacteria bacterium]|nr:DNA polymerase I [Acidobacteriota bacterium]